MLSDTLLVIDDPSIVSTSHEKGQDDDLDGSHHPTEGQDKKLKGSHHPPKGQDDERMGVSVLCGALLVIDDPSIVSTSHEKGQDDESIGSYHQQSETKSRDKEWM